ncbi:MAG: RNA polymerase sigma factor [Bacteroidota bacterium]
MTVKNPFSKDFDSAKDTELIIRAIDGNSKALNELVQRHNNFIYNVAIKMLGKADAEDATQDILIKVITNLSSFDPDKAQFRTWLYRITFNHILNYKKSRPEKAIQSFDQFFGFIENLESQEPNFGEQNFALYSNETKMKCMHGMLMCLSREQRLLFVVGDIFQIDHNLGAEIFGTTPTNFRKRLSRTRKELVQWMDNKCGLVNKNNPCRCPKKTKGFIRQGIVDPENLLWEHEYKNKIGDFTESKFHDTLRSQDDVYRKLYQEQPFVETKSAEKVMEEILGNDTLKEFLNL